jgi:hypothetical protein
MLIDDQETAFSNAFTHHLMPAVTALLLAGALILAGCDSNGAAEDPEIADVIISPDTVSLAVGDQIDFSAVALTADGDTIQGVTFQWTSTDPSVFTVADDGMATAQGAGTAFCGVKPPDDAASKTALVPIGLDSAFVNVFLN